MGLFHFLCIISQQSLEVKNLMDSVNPVTKKCAPKLTVSKLTKPSGNQSTSFPSPTPRLVSQKFYSQQRRMLSKLRHITKLTLCRSARLYRLPTQTRATRTLFRSTRHYSTTTSQTFEHSRRDKILKVWLLTISGLVVAIIIVGGLTRLEEGKSQLTMFTIGKADFQWLHGNLWEAYLQCLQKNGRKSLRIINNIQNSKSTVVL